MAFILHWILHFLSIIKIFFFFLCVFWPLEKMFPAKVGQRFFRPDWGTDLCFFLGQNLFWGSLVLTLLESFGGFLTQHVSLEWRQQIATQPLGIQIVEVVLFSDVLIYWGHRLQHRVDFLWRFHAIHHSAEHLDWLAAHREHPVDTVYTMGIINLPLFIMGFPTEFLAKFIAFRGIWAIFIHSNVRIPLGPIRVLIGSPELHHWHHDRARDAGNYANLSPLMDVFFRTYTCPDHEPENLGLKTPIPKSYVGQMLFPFWKKKM